MKVTKVYHFLFESIYFSTTANSVNEARQIITQKLHNLQDDQFHKGFIKIPVPSALFGVEVTVLLSPFNFEDAVLVDVEVLVSPDE